MYQANQLETVAKKIALLALWKNLVKPLITKTRANQGDSRGILVSRTSYNSYRD
jgi:hypothetical protein